MLHEMLWHEFAARHKGQTALNDEALYPLSARIIDALAANMGDLTAEEIRFERDLASTSPMGFFHRRPIGRGVIWPAGTVEEEDALDRHEKLGEQAVKTERAAQLKRLGLDERRAEDQIQDYESASKRIDERRESFLGWLVGQEAFWNEVAELRERFGTAVARSGFPVAFKSQLELADFNAESPLDEMTGQFLVFYGRWSLNSLWSWELPEPMQPILNPQWQVTSYPQASPQFLVPWFLLRDKSTSLSDLLRFTRLDAPANLADWFKTIEDRSDSAKGPTSAELVAHVYRYDVLALSRRYGERINRVGKRGWRNAADEAIGDGMASADTIKRARKTLTKALARNDWFQVIRASPYLVGRPLG